VKRGRMKGNGRLWKRDGTWVLDYRDEHGSRRHRALGKNKRQAESLQAELIAQRNRRILGLDEAPKDMALDELRNRYLEDMAARTSSRHVYNVRLTLDRVLQGLPATTVGGLTPAMLLEYRAGLLAQGRSNRCCNVHRQALCGMLAWGVGHDLIPKNPITRVHRLPEGKRHQVHERRALTDAEIERFLAAAREYDKVWGTAKARVPQAPFWRGLLDTAARYGELRQTTWADLDEQAGVLCFRAQTTKAGQAREVPLQEDYLAELVALRGVHWRVLGRRPSQADPVFLAPTGALLSPRTNNPRRAFNQILKRARIEPVDALGRKIDIHGLRHTAVSRYLRAGVPLGLVQRIAGHSDPRLTAAIYGHLERDDLRGAVEALSKTTRAEPSSATGT